MTKALAILAVTTTFFNNGCPFVVQRSIECADVSVRLEPGTCVLIANPCQPDGIWLGPGDPPSDAFSDDSLDSLDRVWVAADATVEPSTRSICADQGAQPEKKNSRYTYQRTHVHGVDKTIGLISVEILPVIFSVQATANPPVISPGGSSQLDVVLKGGFYPYSIRWTPETGLSDASTSNPIASPSVTTDYVVTVIDSNVDERSATVRVTVAAPLNASFTFVRGALNPVARTVHWSFDASASTGAIANYAWDLLGNDGTAIHADLTTPVLELDLPESALRGTMTLTLTDTGGSTATLTLPYR